MAVTKKPKKLRLYVEHDRATSGLDLTEADSEALADLVAELARGLPPSADRLDAGTRVQLRSLARAMANTKALDEIALHKADDPLRIMDAHNKQAGVIKRCLESLRSTIQSRTTASTAGKATTTAESLASAFGDFAS